MIRNLKQKLINWVLKDLLCAVVPEQVISIEEMKLPNGDTVYRYTIGGEEVSEQTLNVLRQEAKFVKDMTLWTLFQNRLADTARKTMFEKSKTFDDMRWGKAMLYALKVQEDIVDKILDNGRK